MVGSLVTPLQKSPQSPHCIHFHVNSPRQGMAVNLPAVWTPGMFSAILSDWAWFDQRSMSAVGELQ